MAEIGAGLGSDFPNALDTDNQKEKDYPAVDKTVQRADVPNDLAAAILALEGAIGAYGSSQGHHATIWNILRGINKRGCKVEYVDAGTLKVTKGVRWINGKLRYNPTDTNITFANLDTGTEQPNKLYAVWAVADTEKTTMDYYISASFTQPSPGGTPAINYEYLGAFRNGPTSDILRFYRIGDWTYYDDGITNCSVLNGGTSGAWTAVDCSAFIPLTSKLGLFFLHSTGDNINVVGGYIRPTGSDAVDGHSFHIDQLLDGGRVGRLPMLCPTNSSQSIDYRREGGGLNPNLSIYVLGYYDPID